MLVGIISDITWRLEAGAARSKGLSTVNDSLPMRIGFLAAMLPLVLLTVAGVSFLAGNGDLRTPGSTGPGAPPS